MKCSFYLGRLWQTQTIIELLLKNYTIFSEINFSMNIMMGMVTEDTLINYSGMAWSHARIRIADTSTETACQS